MLGLASEGRKDCKQQERVILRLENSRYSGIYCCIMEGSATGKTYCSFELSG